MPNPEPTKFDYFRMELEHVSDMIAPRVAARWKEVSDELIRLRSDHSDWHAEYLQAFREGRYPIAQPDSTAPSWDIEFLAVSEAEMKFGCPYCGHSVSWTLEKYNGAVLCRCDTSGCGRDFVELSEGMTFSPFTFNGASPKIVPHPFRKED